MLDELLEIYEKLKQPCFLVVLDSIPIIVEDGKREGGFILREEVTGLEYPLVLINPEMHDDLIEKTKHRIRWITPSKADWIDANKRKLKEFTWDIYVK
jgi:hypothetical protein